MIGAVSFLVSAAILYQLNKTEENNTSDICLKIVFPSAILSILSITVSTMCLKRNADDLLKTSFGELDPIGSSPLFAN